MPGAGSREQRRYGAAEVREILRHAQKAESTAEDRGDAGAGLTAAELLETAGEVGFSKEQVTTALARYEGDREIVEMQRELRQVSARRFTGHALWFLVVNGLILAANLHQGGPLYALAPLCLWGVFLLLHLRGVLFPDPEGLRLRARKRLANRRLRESTTEFGHALSKGAARLLSATAKKIDHHAERLDEGGPPGRDQR